MENRNNATLDLEKTRARLPQAEEMSLIWEKSSEAAKMYLKGCIVTAAALAGEPDQEVTHKSG